MLKTKIFVYGTLMKDFKNYNKYLKDKATSVETAYIYGKLYHLHEHDCPAIIDGTDKVYGEVIEFIDDTEHTTLNKIDYLEKYFFDMDEIIYERKSINVHYLDNRSEKLFLYKLIKIDVIEHEHAEYIESGDWKDYLNNLKGVVS